MRERFWISFVLVTLFLVLMFPMDVSVVVESSGEYGDLILDLFFPVQVIKDASALVDSKLTLVEIWYCNTFHVSKTTDIIVRINGVKRAQETRTLKPGLHKLDDDEGGWVPPKNKPFSVEIVSPQVTIEVEIVPVPNEIDVTNNKKSGTFKVKKTYEPFYLWITVGSRREPATKATIATAWRKGPAISKSMQFVEGTYPIKDVRYSPAVLVYTHPNPSGPGFVLTDEGLIELFKILAKYGGVTGVDRVIGFVNQGWIGRNWVGGASAGVTAASHAIKSVLSENGYWINPAHELGHTYCLDDEAPAVSTVRYWIEKRDLQKEAKCFMGSGPAKNDFKISGEPAWICKSCYEGLLKNLTEGADPEVLFISGMIFRNGTTVLDDWYRLPYGYPDISLGATGNYTIKFKDNLGQVINQTGFNAPFGIEAYTLVETNVTGFAFNIPWVNGTSQIQIQNATGHVLATRNVSANPPTVNVTYPNGGEVLNPETNHTITWAASDPDGDPLTYSVLASQDGATWMPLAIDLQQTNYIWNITGFPFGSNYLVKVIATDGVNTGQDISDNPFTVNTTYFTVDVTPTHQWVTPGGTASYTINVTSFGGWEGTVALNATVLLHTPKITFSWPTGNTVSIPPNGSATTTIQALTTTTAQPDIYALVITGTNNSLIDVYSVSLIVEELMAPSVGGFWVPVDRLGLLAPYIALASTILVATAATAIYVKHAKRRKKKK